MAATTGEQLRALRGALGVSLSELSRRSGVGKGTISELENDRRGARLDTLFALTAALGAPLSAALPDGPVSAAVAVVGDSVNAVLLDRWTTRTALVEVYRATLSPDEQESDPHADGVEETITVVGGRVLVGPVGGERTLGAGESLRYAGDTPHRFRALDGTADVLLLMHYPLDPVQEGTIHDDR